MNEKELKDEFAKTKWVLPENEKHRNPLNFKDYRKNSERFPICETEEERAYQNGYNDAIEDFSIFAVAEHKREMDDYIEFVKKSRSQSMERLTEKLNVYHKKEMEDAFEDGKKIQLIDQNNSIVETQKYYEEKHKREMEEVFDKIYDLDIQNRTRFDFSKAITGLQLEYLPDSLNFKKKARLCEKSSCKGTPKKGELK